MSLGKLSPEAGVALLGLGSALRGQDPAQAVLGAQRVLLEREEREEEKALKEQVNKAIDASNLPESQKELLKQLDVRTQASVLFKEPKPEPGKQEVIDAIIRKIQRGETLTAQEQKLYEDLVLRPTYSERLLGQFGGSSQSQPQPGPSIIPTITSEEEFNNLPSGSQFYYNGVLQVKE
jgi:hypothetical protein